MSFKKRYLKVVYGLIVGMSDCVFFNTHQYLEHALFLYIYSNTSWNSISEPTDSVQTTQSLKRKYRDYHSVDFGQGMCEVMVEKGRKRESF